MSVLFWLFGLGALGIAFPFIFHLIRRQPQGQIPFSSLMFLKPTPPRISRRSRVENWLLLLLRCLALLLIAGAFMRPFLPDTASLLQDNTVPRRVAILVDTSASMQRNGIWEQVPQRVQEVVDTFESTDQLALFTFDRQLKTVIDFPSESESVEESERRQTLIESLEFQHPSWFTGQLSMALISLANHLMVTNENQGEQGLSQLQIVLISDLQEPDDLQRLQSFQWPEAIKLELASVDRPATHSADARISLVQAQVDGVAQPRLRILNSEKSERSGFEVRWSPETGSDDREPRDSDFASDGRPPLRLQVPPGQQQTVDLQEDTTIGRGVWRLSGDQDTFGNSFFIAGPEVNSQRIIYLTDSDANDAGSSAFFFRHAIPESPTVVWNFQTYSSQQNAWTQTGVTVDDLDSVSATAASPAPTPQNCAAIIVDRELEEAERRFLEQFVADGGTVVTQLGSNPAAESLAPMSGVRWSGPWEPKAGTSKYLLLGNIDFDHELMTPFQQPGFNDFTNIHFWDAAAVQLEDEASSDENLKIVAKFDNGLPAIWEFRPTGSQGRVVGLAFDWHPDHSQLGLSSKFVPMVKQLVDPQNPLSELPLHFWLADRIPLPTADADWEVSSISNEVADIEVRQETDGAWFTVAQPGLYRASQTGESDRFYAVNLHPSEFTDHRLVDEHFLGFNIPLGRQPSKLEQKQQERLKKDMELEDSQKLWKYLIAGAMVLLIAEMFVAGRRGVPLEQQQIPSG